MTISVTRKRRRALGLCRDCGKEALGKLRCALCQKEKSLPGLAAWQITKQELRDHFSVERSDRRHNGKSSRALDWALAVRTA